MTSELKAQFLQGRAGRLFALARIPAPGCNAALFVAPFGEEMNKSRHLFSSVAERLALRGVGSVLVDHFGTGDSEGEFAQARWETWIEDLGVALRWSVQLGMSIDRVLGVRLGCALAAQAAKRQGWSMRRTAFWQPVGSGGRALDQFLRLRVAASLMQKDGKETVAALRARLNAGESIEVAGYELGPELARELDRIDLANDMTPELGSVAWFEIVRSAQVGPSVPSSKIIETAQARGLVIDLQAVCGEPFWSSVEIVQNADLIERTVGVLEAA